MEPGGRSRRADAAEDLARSAVDWMLRTPGKDWEDPSLYHGRAGILLALEDARAQVDDAGYDDALELGCDSLSAIVDEEENCSLYFGLTGTAFTLHALGREAAARRALHRVRERSEGGRWSTMFELFAGNAGVGLGALMVGDVELAVDAVTPYRSTATKTAHGVNWPVRPTPPRSHHIAHGTLGIVYALAAVGRAAGRPDLVELAIEGADDVVGRDEAGPDGFLVPHSDPPHRPELIERYSLGWCNGPAGDAQVFRLLGEVTGQESWSGLADRCWHTVTASGLPHRVRPGFWDNNGRCCGTAGVLALACDRIVENGDTFDFADVLVDDLAARATVDQFGARWSNYEHRATPPDLEPRPGWAMGNAGIVRELLRYSRLCRGRPGTYAVSWPDHPPTLSAIGRPCG
ncbi:lanthionine synthetase LanC family protein [Terrabacter sp. GCM10028922]|uniref:lanthionine synthetase LanC family protein n=1 Tax=Terrabacter sp. GCM10028922 TaxID=3273428 RepID=UPI0036101BD2